MRNRLVWVVVAAVGCAWGQASAGVAMPENARQVFAESMRLSDEAWDRESKFVHVVGSDEHTRNAGRQMVRETSWYALGLLMRDAKGDRARAAEALDAVLKQQYMTPGVRWYGTFKRSPEETDPGPDAKMWTHYDPNWRVFIGTTFELILLRFPERLPRGLAERMYRSIDVALDGEKAEGRLSPSYSNIALMYGALLDFAAAHGKRADQAKYAADWDNSVYRLFERYHAFEEYNSPTYYGVDLYGLGLWRSFGSSERIRTMGAAMEATLWRDIAEFYQPGLRNVAGPYDRSYGMDMESYVSVVGVWMRTVLPERRAPLPTIDVETDHVADIWFAPLIALLGTRVPADAMAKLNTFKGPHLVKRQITAERTATAWVGEKVIYGGEATSGTKGADAISQFHAATVQWRTPTGEVGWIRLVTEPPVNAVADEHTLTIAASGDVLIRLYAKGADAAMMTKDEWKLPGMDVGVVTDAKGFEVERKGEFLEVRYSGMTRMVWRPEAR